MFNLTIFSFIYWTDKKVRLWWVNNQQNYGFSRLVELFEAIPETVQVLVKDSLQFVQLKPNLMLDFICLNLVKYLEENNFKIKISLSKLEEIYNSKYELIFYQDFGCENFVQLFSRLPFTNNYIKLTCFPFIGIHGKIKIAR